MSRKEDILFCKIAVANGLVSAEQAQKCLLLCDKREKETGRRPMVGAIFTKYNLLKPQEVQRIYAAVRKRLGKEEPAEVAPGRTSRSRRGRRTARAGGAAPAHPRSTLHLIERKATRKLDPTTVWMGIAFGVIFVGVIIVMIVIWITHGSGRKPMEEETAGRTPAPAVAPSTPRPVTAAGGAETGAPTTAQPATSPAARTMDPAVKDALLKAMQDARRQGLIEEDPKGAVEFLRKTYEEAKSKHYVSPDFAARVESVIRELEERAQGGGPAENGELPEG